MRLPRHIKSNRRRSVQRADSPTPTTSAMIELRRRYFAQAGPAAAHLGVSFDRIIHHLWDARRRRLHLSIRAIVYLDDLVHVIACVDGSNRAWHELAELYEPWLVRRLRPEVGPTGAVLAVRQVMVELRQALPSDSAHTALHDYLGMQPLRDWLTARVCRHLARRVIASAPAAANATSQAHP